MAYLHDVRVAMEATTSMHGAHAGHVRGGGETGCGKEDGVTDRGAAAAAARGVDTDTASASNPSDAVTVQESPCPVAAQLGLIRDAVCTNVQGHPPPPATQVAMAEALIDADVLGLLARVYRGVHLEARKALTAAVCACAAADAGDFASVYLLRHTHTLAELLSQYTHMEAGLCAGQLVRAAVQSSAIVHVGVLTAEPHADDLCPLNAHVVALARTYIHDKEFGIAGDAMYTLRCLLTSNPRVVCPLLNTHQVVVLAVCDALLAASSFNVQRGGFKLLADLLLDVANFQLMTRFVNSAARLRIVMRVMRSPRSKLCIEAFHVFKLFVANPSPSAGVVATLLPNVDRLCAYLPCMCVDMDTPDLVREKTLLTRLLRGMAARGQALAGAVPATTLPLGSTVSASADAAATEEGSGS